MAAEGGLRPGMRGHRVHKAALAGLALIGLGVNVAVISRAPSLELGPASVVDARGVPGQEVPGQEVPGQEVPGQEVPGQEVPGQEVPGQEVPGQEVPGQEVPGQEPLASDAFPSSGTRITGLEVASSPASFKDPVRLAMTYDNGRLGAVLQATWTIDGQRFRSLRVVLASASGEHVITSVPPEKGWPGGEHRIVLSSGGVAMREVVFRVS